MLHSARIEGDLGAVFMIELVKGRRGSAQGHDLSLISRCYECLRAQQWTQRGVRTRIWRICALDWTQCSKKIKMNHGDPI